MCQGERHGRWHPGQRVRRPDPGRDPRIENDQVRKGGDTPGGCSLNSKRKCLILVDRFRRLNLTQTYFGSENWAALIPAAQDLLSVDPLNGLVWILLTRAHSELEQTEEAKSTQWRTMAT